MASAPPASHPGFAVIQSDCDCNNCIICASQLLGGEIQNLTSHQLKNRLPLYRIWKLAFGAAAPSIRRIYVISEPQTLKKHAPIRGKGYPSFITPLEYNEPDSSDDEDEEKEEVEPMIPEMDGSFVILLPGAYDASRLWKRSFTGTSLIIGLRTDDEGLPPIVYSRSGAALECHGTTFVGTCVLETHAKSDDTLITVTGNARLFRCIITPERDTTESLAPAEESGHLVQVQHGGNLTADGSVLQHSTHSCIHCEGHCNVVLYDTVFHGAGMGDKYHRISKANGTFPRPVQARFPAIGVSYAATITATECQFDTNYGYPLQYTSKAEEIGAVDQNILDEDPEEYARRTVEQQELTSKKARQSVYRQELERRRQEVEQARKKRIKGSLKMTGCLFRENCFSPYLPNFPDGSQMLAKVAPWFAESNKIMQLVDADNGLEPLEPYYMHEEARRDRDTWAEYYYNWDESLAAGDVLDSLEDDDSFIDTLVNAMGNVDRWSCPREVLRASRTVDSDTELHTAYGMLDEAELAELRKTMAEELEATRREISATVEEMTESPRSEELCWGILTDNDAGNRAVLIAEATIVALFSGKPGGRPVSAYRAEVLVERMQCLAQLKGIYVNEDGCECDGTIASAKYTAFLLGLVHNSVVEALFDLVNDVASSSHGKSNAAEVLSRLAFFRQDLRNRVTECLSLVVRDDAEISECSRGMLVFFLGLLHARESKNVVEAASLNGKVDNAIYGGFIAYLQLVGLPVDISDAAVEREVKLPPDVEDMVSENELRKLTKKSIAKKKKAIKTHNATLRGSPPCEECGKRPPKGEEFPLCTGCRQATYCGKVCQRASWKGGHKAVCKPPRKSKGKK